MIGPLHEEPGFRGAELKNSRVLRDPDGLPTLRVEICPRKEDPTEWHRLRGEYLVALACAAEEMYMALSRARLGQDGTATITPGDTRRIQPCVVRIQLALEALMAYEGRKG